MREGSSRDSSRSRERGSGEGSGERSGPKRGGFFRRRKSCPFSGPKGRTIDWKDIKTLGRFVSERGKIMPSRLTSVSAGKQRLLAQAIKRARYMALMPHMRYENDGPSPRQWKE
ncbi:MAG: 30S ribosomal protein S18 [Proteobacteria bacterium]|nr:30S ribosomal protein S18 [Pseudomonadota bacterium]